MDSMFYTLLARSLAGGGGGGTNNYNALENKPSIDDTTLQGNMSLSDLGIAAAADIPTVNNGTLTIQKNGANIDTFSANQSSNTTINITVPTTAADVSALPSSTKYAASLSMSINSSTYVVTGQLKDQDGNDLGNAQTIDLPLETMVVGGSYDDVNKKIVLTLKNGNTVDIPVADLVSGLQTELSAVNKLNPAYIDYDSTHAAVTEAEKSSWGGKQDTTLTGYTIDAAEASITASSTVTDGIEQLDYRSVRDKSAIIELVDSGAKNKLSIGIPTSVPTGLSCTRNTEGTYTVSGTLTAPNSISFSIDAIDGDLVLSGCPEGGGNDTYLLRITKSGSQVAGSVDIGNGSDVFTMDGSGYALNMRFAAGSYTDLIFKPMICSAAAWAISQAYVPYRPSYQELYEMVLALQGGN